MGAERSFLLASQGGRVTGERTIADWQAVLCYLF
jgi:hypothetical protein